VNDGIIGYSTELITKNNDSRIEYFDLIAIGCTAVCGTMANNAYPNSGDLASRANYFSGCFACCYISCHAE
jgi:hypothetical protein